MVSQASFVKKVISEITIGGRLPNKINMDRLSQIITDAIDLFRDRDDRTTTRHHMIIMNGAFNTDLFRRHRKVLLPECVKAVTNLELSNRQYTNHIGGVDSDFNKLGSFAQQFAGSGQGTTLLQAIASTSYYDYANNLILDSVSYDFSEYSHELTITGGTPRADLIAEVYSYVCDEAMYAMPSFYRYVVGKCYEEYVIVTTFTKQMLLNSYQIDIAKIEKKGEKMMSAVEKEWDNQLNESDFILEF